MRSIPASLTLGLLLASASPGLAQDQLISDDERALIRLFGEADTAYSNADCATHIARLDAARRRLDEARARSSISAAMAVEYMQREFQSRQRICPRDTTPPSPPARTATQPGMVPGAADGVAEYDRQFEAIQEQFARRMLRARRATAARDCADRNAALDEAFEVARDGLLRLRGSTEGIDGFLAEIRLERARPCGPSATTDELPPEEQYIQNQQLVVRQRQAAEAAERQRRELMDTQRMHREQEEANRQAARSLLQVFPAYGQWQLPPTNYGFQRDGAAGTSPERPAGFSTERVETFGFGFGLQIGAVSVDLGYAEGDARNRTDIAASTTGGARGYPYTDNSPSGSTGIGGNVAIGVDTDVSVNEYSGSVEYRFSGPDFRDPATWRYDVGYEREIMTNFSLGAQFIRRDVDHRGVVSITTPVVATQTLDQDVDELEVGVSAGVRVAIPLSAGASLTLGGEVGAFLYDFDLSSIETNSQNFGPAADRAFTIKINDGQSGVGYRGAAHAELGFALSRSMVLFAAGSARYSSDRARIVNPSSGDFVLSGGTTFLDTRSAFDWQVGIGLRMLLRGGNFR